MFPRGEQQWKLKLHLTRNPENLLFQEKINASADFLVVKKNSSRGSRTVKGTLQEAEGNLHV